MSRKPNMVERMLADPAYAGSRDALLKEVERLERRRALDAARRAEIAELPFKVRVRLEDKDWMGSWHSWNVEALTGDADAKHPNGTWEVIGSTYDSGPGRWDASYYPDGPEGQRKSVSSGWGAASTKHEAVMTIAHHHADHLGLKL